MSNICLLQHVAIKCVTSTGTLKAAKAWINRPMHGPRKRTRHTGSAETLVTVMANLRLNGTSER